MLSLSISLSHCLSYNGELVKSRNATPQNHNDLVLHKYINEFRSTIFSEDGTVLFCLMCEKIISAKKKFEVVHYINTMHHKGRIQNKSALNQQLITSKPCEQSSSSDALFKALCLALMGSSIPLSKLNNVQLWGS